jgi:hypothetical protein
VIDPDRFDLDTLMLMQQAFEIVCAKLKIDEANPVGARWRTRLSGCQQRKHFKLAELAKEAITVAMPPPARPSTPLSRLAARGRNRQLKGKRNKSHLAANAS